MHASFSLIDLGDIHFNIETDWHLGPKTQHLGKPSEYAELADEYQLSLDWKQWVKFNLNIADTWVTSQIWEITIFEFQPFKLYSWAAQPESFYDMITNFS